MKNKKNKIAQFTLLLFGLFFINTSFAVIPIVYDPYDVIENTITARNSIQSLINQIKQLQCEIQNLQSYQPGHMDNTNQLLQELAEINSQGESLSYNRNHLDDVFQKKFPGLVASHDYPNDFTIWSNTVRDTVKDSMLGLAMQNKTFSQEETNLKELENLSNNAKGNLQAQQASHRIALQQISQLQKLRQLLLNQASTQNAYVVYQVQKEQSSHAASHNWVVHSQTPMPPYDDHHGFGVNDIPNLEIQNN